MLLVNIANAVQFPLQIIHKTKFILFAKSIGTAKKNISFL